MHAALDLALHPLLVSGAPGAPAGRAGRFAAIDIGSNSIHMIVVEPALDGTYRTLGREREMVRLGRSALGRGALSAEAMRDGIDALVKMVALASLKGADRAVAVATCAVREAENGAEFLARVRAQTGLDVLLLSGEEEGALIYRSVREVVDFGSERAAVVDLGGGSTEWVSIDRGKVASIVSLPLGSLRCAGDLAGDPPSPRAIERLRRALRAEIVRSVSTPVEPTPATAAKGKRRVRVEPVALSRLIATSGTAIACADLIDGRAAASDGAGNVGLREVRTADLVALVARLTRMKRREMAALPAVGGPRSESLLAGAILLLELVEHAKVERFWVSDRALREGLVLAAVGRGVAQTAAGDDPRRRQILRLAERTESVLDHNRQTARLAVRLFDLTVSLHRLGGREREWLEYAALLHDIGYSIQYRGHHRHSYYLILHGSLDAFDPSEVEIIASVARFHRGAAPRSRHPALARLAPWQQKTIRKLAALLRVADALDRTHASRVEELFCSIRRSRVVLEVMSGYAVDLELEAAALHGALFEKVFGRRLRLRQGLEEAGSSVH